MQEKTIDLSDCNVYEQTTNDVSVSVVPLFIEDESSPDDFEYLWAYYIKIQNNRDDEVQLMSRKWQITDAQGLMQVVEGDGVIGDQPKIIPGDCYEYTSGVSLKTPSGIMQGIYYMRKKDQEIIEVEIPAFSLDSTYQNDKLN